ncbi:DUF3179 domain-containing protein [candidate division KSB1 bacterium]|nr:DUF3179 domain-containing protein [candidate division KSB1 bacterium]
MCKRTLDEKTLTISASGWTDLTRFILYDYETKSMWFPLTGTTGLTAISGHYADRKLEEIASQKTTWNL